MVLRRDGLAGELTDGIHTLRGGAVADAVQSLVSRLAAQRVGPGAYVEFRCEHDLASALLWLALLEAGVSAYVSASDPRVARVPALNTS